MHKVIYNGWVDPHYKNDIVINYYPKTDEYLIFTSGYETLISPYIRIYKDHILVIAKWLSEDFYYVYHKKNEFPCILRNIHSTICNISYSGEFYSWCLNDDNVLYVNKCSPRKYDPWSIFDHNITKDPLTLLVAKIGSNDYDNTLVDYGYLPLPKKISPMKINKNVFIDITIQ